MPTRPVPSNPTDPDAPSPIQTAWTEYFRAAAENRDQFSFAWLNSRFREFDTESRELVVELVLIGHVWNPVEAFVALVGSNYASISQRQRSSLIVFAYGLDDGEDRGTAQAALAGQSMEEPERYLFELTNGVTDLDGALARAERIGNGMTLEQLQLYVHQVLSICLIRQCRQR
jgi:hypothetical protein